MNFEFSSDQYMLRDSVRRYLSEQWGPKQVRAAKGAWSQSLWQGLSDLGVQSLLVPESHGGAGLQMEDVALVLEEFGRALVPSPMAETLLATHVIARHGSQAQHEALFSRILEGQARIAWAHVEPGAGHGAQDVRLQARRDGQAWRLSGHKLLVGGASVATHYLVSAREEGGRLGLFLCQADASVSVSPHQAMDQDALLAEVRFDSTLAMPIGIGPDQQPLDLLLECAAFSAALQMVGVAGQALEMAVEYAKQRVQFDRPIGSFQAIKHKCADMLVALEGARSAAYHAAWALDAGEPVLAVSMAKSSAGDACRMICNESLQIHGGVGFTWEFDVHLYLKRGKLLEHSFGDAAMHRERIASMLLDAR